jgi:hypothetical protein
MSLFVIGAAVQADAVCWQDVAFAADALHEVSLHAVLLYTPG